MDEKINLKAIDQYSILFANRLADIFFAGHVKITGQEILSLSEIKQINLFVINDLLSAWKNESEKLKSPYFDYGAKSVAESLILFQNTLSNHILISKPDFLPLLKQATYKTLLLILAPYDFYADVLDQKGSDSLSTSSLKNFVKYVKINKPPLEKLIAHLESKNKETLSGKEAFALLDHILEEVNFTPEDIEPYLLHFNTVVPLSVEKFYEESVSKKAETKVVTQSKVEFTVKPAVVETKVVPTVADDLARKKVIRLKESLTINQKFMFTKILFHGDFEIFTEAIDRIDRFDNLSQAMRFLDDGYPDWDRESEEYEEFVEILQKRFP